MMIQQNKIFVCVQLYYGPSRIFLHMQIFMVGVLKGNLLVLFVIRIVGHIDSKQKEMVLHRSSSIFIDQL